MENKKSVGKILKELDNISNVFDKSNKPLIVKKKKVTAIKTSLTSTKIDTDFFKISKSLTKKNISENKNIKSDEKDILFSLDRPFKAKKTVPSKDKNSSDLSFLNSLKEKKEKRNTEISSKDINQAKKETQKNKPVEIKNNPIKTQVEDTKEFSNTIQPKKIVKDNTYLSIKERLEQIKQEAANQVITKKGVSSKRKDPINTNSSPASKNIASTTIPIIETKNTSKQIKNTDSEIIKNNPIAKNNFVDKLTIFILILLIALIATAWFFLN